MAKELTATKTALPAHIAAAFGGNTLNSDLRQGVSAGYPIISYKGKSWALVQNGERNLITRGGDGHDADDPASSIAVVIVKANPHLNKVYYPDGYEEGSTERPICHSNDSITPAPDAQEPQAKRCAVCPHNQWGSKITETAAGSGGVPQVAAGLRQQPRQARRPLPSPGHPHWVRPHRRLPLLHLQGGAVAGRGRGGRDPRPDGR
jgi:hypothetical protein